MDDAEKWVDSILASIFPDEYHVPDCNTDTAACSNVAHPSPSPPPSPISIVSAESAPPRFAFQSDSSLEEVKSSSVPKNTARCTKWAYNIWLEWSKQRKIQNTALREEWPDELLTATPTRLDYWLSKFVIEVRRNDGQPYPPNSLYNITCGLLRYIRQTKPDINIFQDSNFFGFRKALDGRMKQLRCNGIGVQTKQAEPLSIEEEDQLWRNGHLGDHSPQVLLDTMLYLCGIYFAMRSGEEHRSLQITQFEIVESSGIDKPGHLIYYENFSKNNSGGLAHRKVTPKKIVHYENIDNTSRCLVSLFRQYISHRPTDTKETAFYLTPLRNPKSNVWYSGIPVGKNTLAKTVGRICKNAEISGHKTNHSLRVTSATRLFQKGVDEQLIMSRTGHRSIDGVRKYKRVSEQQHINTSNILNSCTNGEELLPALKRPVHHANESSTPSTTNASQSLITQCSNPSTINFNGCSNITINILGQQNQ